MKRMLLLAFFLAVSTAWAGGPYSLTPTQYEIDSAIASVTTNLTTKATVTGSNIIATTTFLTAIGGAAQTPTTDQGYRWETHMGYLILADNAVATFPIAVGSDDSGELFVDNRNAGRTAKFWWQPGATAEVHDVDTAYSPTKDNAATVNIYFESGWITIQNKSGGQASVKYRMTGWNE